MKIRRRHLAIPREKRFRNPFTRVPGSWLPGALTLGNMLGGYAAILAAAEDHFFLSAILIVIAGFFDAIDGRVARLTKTTSPMGKELDSLCDAVSFAVAPSMLVFHMGIQSLGRFGYAVCFLFAACGVLRLARFNTLPSEHHDFIGLPIPMGALAVTTPVLVRKGLPIEPPYLVYQALSVAIVGLLMVSRIRYRSFKDVRFGARPYRALALFASVLALLVAFAEWVFPGLVLLYLFSPAIYGAGRLFGWPKSVERGNTGPVRGGEDPRHSTTSSPGPDSGPVDPS